MNREFIEALEQISKEKELNPDIILEAVEISLATACKKNYGTSQNVEVTIASHGFKQEQDNNNSNQDNSHKKNKKIDQGLLNQINGISVQDDIKEHQIKETLGNTVSYLA